MDAAEDLSRGAPHARERPAYRFSSSETMISDSINCGTSRLAIEFLQHLQKGSTLARRALLWVLQRQQHPRTKFDDIQFTHDQVELVYDRDELVHIRGELEKQVFESETIRVAALQAIDDEMATAPGAPGKAPANSDD